MTINAPRVADYIDISGEAQAQLSTSTTADQTPALDGGIYDVWSTADAYIKVAEVADDVTTSTGYLLRANTTVPVRVPQGQKIGAILGSSTGTLSFHKVA